MAERYSVSEAARKIGIARRTFYNWLAQEPATAQQLHSERSFTRAQLERLAEKHGKHLESDFRDLAAADVELAERIEALEARVSALEHDKTLTSAPGGSINVSAVPETRQNRSTASQGRISKADAARLIADRHGVAENTARQWNWPVEALASADAAEAWALAHVASMPAHKRPHGWR